MEQNKTERISQGLPAHTNEPAEYNGIRGYWVQSECVFIEGQDPSQAVMRFRKDFPTGSIAVGHNLGTDGVHSIKLRKQLTDAQKVAEDAFQHAASLSEQLHHATQEEERWVSTKERLPEVGWNDRLSHPVYVYGLGRPPGIRHYEPGAESWYDAAHGCDEPRHWYSHWMPVPAPPKTTCPTPCGACKKGGVEG
ncbi:hypothetical protein [Hymenobacter fodinae]|uniref:DUF551 domain-containing protein n=1 Tax=Hymenobacter fodinae TaxID=2510796 RepID=A0A4Z0P3R2_9BACT|nr:hypothetical protein [Hymenobacter fodinae]TGE05588.1 hypothetical protein EU556_20010 [Hymenobacter fodinae]